jgi:hypothetical protein
VVVWDLHWHVLDCQRLEPAADLSGAMAAAIERLAGDGWQVEATPEYGFVFVRRETERRLLMLTPRDPYRISHALDLRSLVQFPNNWNCNRWLPINNRRLILVFELCLDGHGKLHSNLVQSPIST